MTDPGRNTCLTLQSHLIPGSSLSKALAMIGDAGRQTGVAHMRSSLPGGMSQGVGVSAWSLPCQLPCLLFSLVFRAYRRLTLSWYLCVQAVVFRLSIRPDRLGHSGDIEYIFLDNLRTT